MITHEEVVNRVLEQVSKEIAGSIKDSVTQTIQKELSSTMTKSLVQSEFYRYLNEEMRHGLKGIFQEISSASSSAPQEESAPRVDHTQQLFTDTTKQIDEIMQTVLSATENIMEISEKLLLMQEEAGDIIATLQVPTADEVKLARLDTINSEFAASLTEIITSLSFQDLTGQRLKKVVAAITTIRETVFDLYVSTGLMLQHSDDLETKSIADIKKESDQAVHDLKTKNSELKGPVIGVSQTGVDDLLASLRL